MASRTTLPLHPVAVIVADQVWLRIYRGNILEIEIPLRRQTAPVLELENALELQSALPE
jgi:hypothetical protein